MSDVSEDLSHLFDDSTGVIDLSGVAERTVTPVPAGVYNCNVEEANKKNSAAGNPMIEWRFRISDGDQGNRVLFWHTVLHKEAGLANLKRAIAAIAPEKSTDKFNVNEDLPDLIGRACRVRTKMGKGREGEDRSEVASVMPAGPDDQGFFS